MVVDNHKDMGDGDGGAALHDVRLWAQAFIQQLTKALQTHLETHRSLLIESKVYDQTVQQLSVGGQLERVLPLGSERTEAINAALELHNTPKITKGYTLYLRMEYDSIARSKGGAAYQAILRLEFDRLGPRSAGGMGGILRTKYRVCCRAAIPESNAPDALSILWTSLEVVNDPVAGGQESESEESVESASTDDTATSGSISSETLPEISSATPSASANAQNGAPS